MLRLPPFRYSTPDSLDEVLRILDGEGPPANGGGARVVAGGTDLWPNMKRRHQKAEHVVSLMRVPDLSGITNGDGLTIGGTALLSDVAAHEKVLADYPGLATAVRSISSPPLRQMATLGGNLLVDTRCTYYNQTEEWRRSIDYCMKEEGQICWVAPSSPRCWAHSASDSAPMLAALGAEVTLVSTQVSTRSERRIPVADLYRNDGIEYLGLAPGEILTAVHLPKSAAAPQCRSSFWKLRRRGSIDFAVLSVAVAAWFDGNGVDGNPADGGTARDVHLFLGAVASQPLHVPAASEILSGNTFDEDRIAAVAQEARKLATPMDNTDFLAQWRGKVVESYVTAALREVAGRNPGLQAPAHT